MNTPSYHACSRSKGLPGLPPLPKTSENEEPSELYQLVLRHSEHPPIMKGTSWTLAAPFKEQKYHRTPSESIANNYTPSANDLKLKDISKMKRASHAPAGTTKPHLSPRGKGEMNGESLADKAAPPSRPLTPMEQMEIMLHIEREDAETKVEPDEQDLERYYYYIEKGVKPDMIARQNDDVMKRVHSMIPVSLLKSSELNELQNQLLVEVKNDYEFSIRKTIGEFMIGTEYGCCF
ncbi:dynein axonemal heavy chain 3-like [Tubulanus polymorphus]|uniref:dynein axonemal heavy chain 3-like n=1 Tax=Tubulanus polymorphus TaxID=672921 RepID=UPI003DA4FB8F